MFPDSSHIRRLIKPSSSGGVSEDDKKMINSTHGFVFFLVGMTVYPNTDTSLLTQRIFCCPNFAADCLVYHNIMLTLLALTFTILQDTDHFTILLGSLWGSLLCHIFHILIGSLGRGRKARRLFIFVFGVLGAFRGGVSISAPRVINKLFLLSSYVLFNNSRSAFQLICGVIQGILNNVIGYKTFPEARLNMTFCHFSQAFITFVACVWITIIYIKYKDKADFKFEKIEGSKIKEQFERFKCIKYYVSRFILYHLCSIKYFFHTSLIPFLLELETPDLLKSSVFYTVSEFIGRSLAMALDETVYSKHAVHTSHLFFIVRDIPLFLLIFLIISLNSLILYSAFTGRFAISRQPVMIFIIIAISGFTYGFLATRATVGSRAVFDYRRKKQPEKITASSDIVSESINVTYYCSLLIPFFLSKYAQVKLRKSRLTREYIIVRKPGDLSKQDVDLLYSLLRQG